MIQVYIHPDIHTSTSRTLANMSYMSYAVKPSSIYKTLTYIVATASTVVIMLTVTKDIKSKNILILYVYMCYFREFRFA